MIEYKDLKEQLKSLLLVLEKADSNKEDIALRKKMDELYSSLKGLRRIKDPKIVTACLGPHAVLAARFYNNAGIVEVHDHRGYLLSVRGDVRLQIGGYAMDINQNVREQLLPSGLLGEELMRRNVLVRWVD